MCVKSATEDLRERHYWWEESGVRFQCRACGKCCGGAPGVICVTPDEEKRMADYLKVSLDIFQLKYMKNESGIASIKDLENYDCVFLGPYSRKCTVYQVRPLQCRMFPFWPSMLRDKSVWDYYSCTCPGMNSGRLYSPKILWKFISLNSALCL